MSSEETKTETAPAAEEEAPADAAPEEESTAEFQPVVSTVKPLVIVNHLSHALRT